MMKHRYIRPQICSDYVMPSMPLTLSIQEGTADPEVEILVKEEQETDFFEFEWTKSIFETE